jgi:hypothetical protein
MNLVENWNFAWRPGYFFGLMPILSPLAGDGAKQMIQMFMCIKKTRFDMEVGFGYPSTLT